MTCRFCTASCGKIAAPSARTTADPHTSVRQFSNPASSEPSGGTAKVVIAPDLLMTKVRTARLTAALDHRAATQATRLPRKLSQGFTVRLAWAYGSARARRRAGVRRRTAPGCWGRVVRGRVAVVRSRSGTMTTFSGSLASLSVSSPARSASRCRGGYQDLRGTSADLCVTGATRAVASDARDSLPNQRSLSLRWRSAISGAPTLNPQYWHSVPSSARSRRTGKAPSPQGEEAAHVRAADTYRRRLSRGPPGRLSSQ